MKCPYCSADNDHVVDSRSMAEGTAIRRRRECQACGKRFTTYEHLDEIPMQIIKRDGTRESFDREKIARSLRIACRKRPIGEDRIQELTGAVEQKIIGESEKEISSAKVGELVMDELRQVDQVA
ncbi:MAG: transcriptional repressor NrdR, partial [Candidatus Omnitrophica bacterium]|nr:transcriptional repressor NrdR [Candidatus Omnitrophota bacterium]